MTSLCDLWPSCHRLFLVLWWRNMGWFLFSTSFPSCDLYWPHVHGGGKGARGAGFLHCGHGVAVIFVSCLSCILFFINLTEMSNCSILFWKGDSTEKRFAVCEEKIIVVMISQLFLLRWGAVQQQSPETQERKAKAAWGACVGQQSSSQVSYRATLHEKVGDNKQETHSSDVTAAASSVKQQPVLSQCRCRKGQACCSNTEQTHTHTQCNACEAGGSAGTPVVQLKQTQKLQQLLCRNRPELKSQCLLVQICNTFLPPDDVRDSHHTSETPGYQFIFELCSLRTSLY